MVAWPLIITTVAGGVDLTQLLRASMPSMPAIFTSRKTRWGRHFLYSYALRGVGDAADFIALELEELSQCRPNSLLIVDDQDLACSPDALVEGDPPVEIRTSEM
jgi:hypothetical protein